MESKLRFSDSEELANSISHGIGFILSILAATLLVYFAVLSNDIWKIASTSVFGVTLILLYFSSVMNHSLPRGKAKDFFHNFDQIAIYLLIAGTYTPLALVGIRHDWGWVMFGIEWVLAVTGIFVKVFTPNKFEKGVNVFIITSYVIMGWLLLLFMGPLTKNLTNSSFALVLAGGFFYTFGILFFRMKTLRFSHLIWHVMVIGGSFCHWLAIFLLISDR